GGGEGGGRGWGEGRPPPFPRGPGRPTRTRRVGQGWWRSWRSFYAGRPAGSNVRTGLVRARGLGVLLLLRFLHGPVAGLQRLVLGHPLALLRPAVPVIAFAMEDLALGVDPDEAGTRRRARRRRLVFGLGLRGRLRRGVRRGLRLPLLGRLRVGLAAGLVRRSCLLATRRLRGRVRLRGSFRRRLLGLVRLLGLRRFLGFLGLRLGRGRGL